MKTFKVKTMLIRKATGKDMDTLIRLRLEYLAEHFGDLGETRRQIVRQLEGYFTAHLSQDCTVFLAEENGLPIASAFLIMQQKPANPRFPNGKTGLLLNVYTQSACRRRGAASRLISAVIEEAKRLDLSFIELSATEAGEPLYKSFGFEKKDCSHEMMLVINKEVINN